MRRIETAKAPQAVGPYSQGIIANDFIFVSGQLAINPETNEFNPNLNIEEQTNQGLKNLKEILNKVGLDLKDVVKTEIFLKNISDFKIVNEIYAKYFNADPKPTRQTVEVSNLPLGALIEVSCIAHAHED